MGIVAAGWPSPAEEELIDSISFNDWLIQGNDQHRPMPLTIRLDAYSETRNRKRILDIFQNLMQVFEF